MKNRNAKMFSISKQQSRKNVSISDCIFSFASMSRILHNFDKKNALVSVQMNYELSSDQEKDDLFEQ